MSLRFSSRGFSIIHFYDGQDGQLRHTTSFQPTALFFYFILQGVPKNVPKRFGFLNLNIFRSKKSTKVNEVFSETL